MPIARGVSLGPYEILAHIGAGGMGEVWRARDRRLGRDVAVKVLPGVTANEAMVQRFELEARAAGALNHPGLVTIFDVGNTEGAPYIVMELLHGQTLREAIGDDDTAAPLPLRKAVDYATQIATALAVAHEKGIIHRDLKPENIFVTSEGRVKILDFGLAKLAEDANDVDGKHRTGRHLTSAGMVVGTPGYMSPEQVRARPLDHRTDIFALGSVLYEMLSGRRAFDCRSAVETMHAVLNEDPPPLPDNVPAPLLAIVQHCMEKDPRDRFQSARDLAFQLGMLKAFSAPTSPGVVPLPPMPRRFPVRLAAAALAVLVLAAAGFVLYRARRAGAPKGPQRIFRQLTFGDGLTVFPTVSPDGKTFAYVSAQSGNRDIYLQRVDGRAALDLTSDSPADDTQPAFSPDGSHIAFRSERDGGGIFVMGVTGESVLRLTNVGYNPSWSPDGSRIVFSTAPVELQPQIRRKLGELWVVEVQSRQTKPLVQPGSGGPDFGRDSDAVQPSWSPHGKRIAFWGISNTAGQRDLWTIDPAAPQPKRTAVRVTTDAALHWNPVWSPDGRFLYYGTDADGTLNLWRVPMDEAAGTAAGAPEPVGLPASISGHFSVSQQGTLLYTAVTRSYRLLMFPFDAATGKSGPPRPLFGGTQEILSLEPSPDGQSIAFTTGGQEDVFVAGTDGSRVRQLTNDAARDRVVTWSPDGKTLYFYSNRDGDYHIWSIRADGSGLTRVTDPADIARIGAGKNIYSPGVSPDGRTLAAQTDAGVDVLVHLERPLAQRLEKFDGHLQAPKWSPDGTRLIGTSQDGIELYVPATRRFETILDHGVAPQWLPDGRHVVFFDKQGIGVVDVLTRATTAAPFEPQPGVELNTTVPAPRLSKDGSVLYARQTIEQSNVWLTQLPN